MQTCTGITVEKIRATIEIGGYSVRTPYVKSFNVNKSRSQLASTFSATIEVPASSSFTTGEDIKISAGIKDNEKRIFTGILRQITVNPCFDKPGYYVVNLSGADCLINLENKKFSRRVGGYGFSSFVTITGGPKNRPSTGMSIDKTIARGSHQFTASTPRPKSSEHSKIIKMPERGNISGEKNKINPLSGNNRDNSGTAGLHDHSTLTKGGPAYGVFSVS